MTSATVVRYGPGRGGSKRPQRLSARERAVLDRINRKVTAAPDLDAAMDLVFDSTRRLFPCDRIGLAFLDESGLRLVSRWLRARYEPVLLGKGYTEDLAGSSLKTVIARGRPRIIEDLEAYLASHPGSRSTRLLVREGVRSSLTCPLTVDGRNVAVMFRSSRKPRAYTARHLRLHEAIAERLAQAVEKAYRIELLAAANASYLEMLGFVSHEIKGALAGLVMEGNLLVQGYVGRLKPRQQERVRRMLGRTDQLLTLVRDYLDLARIEGGELRARIAPGVNVKDEIVAPAAGLAASQLKNQGMTLDVVCPALLRVDCDRSLLGIVMNNLLGNAVRYGRRNGRVRLTAGRSDDKLRVTVWNEGAGFRDEDRDRLFRKFSRLNVPEFRGIRGTGVGLYTCWRILQLHGGHIRARAQYGQWAEFEFELRLKSAAGGRKESE